MYSVETPVVESFSVFVISVRYNRYHENVYQCFMIGVSIAGCVNTKRYISLLL